MKLLLSAGKCLVAKLQEINRHPNLPWNFVNHGFLDLSAFPDLWVLLIGRERGKDKSGKSPKKSENSRKYRENPKTQGQKGQSGRTRPNREAPSVETPCLAAFEFLMAQHVGGSFVRCHHEDTLRAAASPSFLLATHVINKMASR